MRVAQAELAIEHGISSFMYYYYWFSGERVLEPSHEKMRAMDLDMPYCIMWANENWTRRWMAAPRMSSWARTTPRFRRQISSMMPWSSCWIPLYPGRWQGAAVGRVPAGADGELP